MRAPRYVLAAFCFACMALSYMDRWNLSVAAPLLMREFGWNETSVGLLQSVFFYGFTASHLPGGWLADRLGGRRVLGTGVLVWSLATGVTPLAGGFAGLAAIRVALGLGEGVNMPSILNLVGRWFPVEERTRATAVVVTGVQTGTLIAMPLSAWIAASFGWRAIFYTYAVFGLAWTALWFRWASESPPPAALRPDGVTPAHLPWAYLLRQRPIWALVLTTFVTNWTIWFFHSWLPTYFMRVHGFSLKESGFASALPNLAMIVAGLASGAVADRLIARGMPITRVRKMLLALGFAGAIALLLLLPQVHTRGGALLCLSAALACFALGATTVLVNSLDLAPAHAGVLVGLQGTVGNVAGMISPVLGGAIVARTASWDLNFYVIAALLGAGAVLWTGWASAEPLTPPPRP
jgi:MFS transporter, ACS family, solute carrier family 17 (sodium-dependent inorganic phosphate cotransporter), other